jgi:hypothetical protein
MTAPARTRTDEDIQRDVLEELRWDARLQPNEIGVSVKDGVVTLTGWVDSYLKKWAAERAAHRVRGGVAVANDVEVRLPSAVERTDADIAAAVARALEWDARRGVLLALRMVTKHGSQAERARLRPGAQIDRGWAGRPRRARCVE